MNEVPWTNASVIGQEAARETWALAARMLLEETARDYHATTSVTELADFVQQRSRIRTSQAHRYWMGDVLFRLMRTCADNREPFLGALVVDAHGRVGESYQVAVEELRREPVGDRDEHAGHERLACYRFFGADLPEGGGEPGPAPASPTRVMSTGHRPATGSGSRTPRQPKPAAPRPSRPAEKTPAVCPNCFIALPASGICDFCE